MDHAITNHLTPSHTFSLIYDINKIEQVFLKYYIYVFPSDSIEKTNCFIGGILKQESLSLHYYLVS